MRRFLAILVAGLLALPLPAASIYVAQSSAGGNTGLDCADARAVASLAAGDWSPGNAIHLCGAVTSTITAQGNGTSGNVISIIFETGSSITVSSCGTNGCLGLSGASYILVDGSPTGTPCGYVNGVDVACNGLISATGEGTGVGNSDSVGIYTRGGSSHIEVRNLEIKGMYVHTCSGGCNDTNPSGNNYALWDNGTFNLFHNLILHDAEAGWKAEVGAANSSLYNSQLYNLNWSVFWSGPVSNTADAVTQDSFHDSDAHDFANWDTTSDKFHHDGCFAAGNNNLANGISHISCYNLYFHGSVSDPTACTLSNGSCMTAHVFMNDGNHFQTYNNLIDNLTAGQYVSNGFIMYQSSGTLDANDAIWNNTVVGAAGAGGYCISLRGDASLDYRNNVLSNCHQLLNVDTSPKATTFTAIDYNTYQNSSLASAWQCGASSFSTLPLWAASTCAGNTEAHSQAFTGSLGLSSAGVPNAASALLGAAVNLTSLGITALDSDGLGVGRPLAGAWTAGAFQGVLSVAPPTNVRVIFLQ